jgi:hypothetical protein
MITLLNSERSGCFEVVEICYPSTIEGDKVKDRKQKEDMSKEPRGK